MTDYKQTKLNKKENKYLELIHSNLAMINKLASLYTDNEEDQKDLVQEIYFQIWKSFDSFKSKSKKSTWLYRICLNTSIQFLKVKNRKTKYINIEKINSKYYHSSSTILDESIQNMFKLIQQLNALDKGIILLYLEDLSHKEIAEIIGISVSNVGTKIQRIKQKLKQLNKLT